MNLCWNLDVIESNDPTKQAAECNCHLIDFHHLIIHCLMWVIIQVGFTLGVLYESNVHMKAMLTSTLKN